MGKGYPNGCATNGCAKEQTDTSHGKFDDLPFSVNAKTAMSQGFGYEYVTAVQAKTVHPILTGTDLVVRAKTGAGKTLSFLLPSIERVTGSGKGCSSPGTIDILVLSPVRELSMQISSEAEKLTQYYSGIRAVCMTGGESWKEDLEALDAAGSCVTLLIATPGRLQSHINKTDGFRERLAHVQILVLDEVDQLASPMFRAVTEEIISALPSGKHRQSLFYSATMSDDVNSLMKLSVNAEYTFVDMLEEGDVTAPIQIVQTYRVVATEDMTLALWSAVRRALVQDEGTPKIIVILMTGRIASYYADAYRKSSTGLDVFEIHARLKQNKRTTESDRFRAAESGILFTSDVSSRGLDYPGVTEVIQLGAPHAKAEYIHRLGRTGRGGKAGRGLLLLHEFERRFLEELADLPLEQSQDVELPEASEIPDFISMDIAKNTKAQAYYSQINHVMRNSGDMSVLEILREAKCFAASIGALDQEGRPPEITEENAMKMGVADINDPCVYIVSSSTEKA